VSKHPKPVIITLAKNHRDVKMISQACSSLSHSHEYVGYLSRDEVVGSSGESRERLVAAETNAV